MDAYSLLEPILKEILDVIKPLKEDWVTRMQIINELQDVVKSVESLRGATVEPFGSFVSKLFTRWGDLDISIELPHGSYISSAGKKQKQSLLEEVQRALRKKGGWRRLLFIPNARVPILKFESSHHQGISCDVSIDNLPGQMKSKFLYWINEIDGRFRDMVLLVKEWAKAHDINNPKAGTLNSYSLSLLVIFHFQTCVPAILPPLKDIYPGNIVDDLKGVRVEAEKQVADICAANIASFRSDKFRAANRSTLSELFMSFLAKFADINLKAPKLGICTFTGQWEPIENNKRWMPKTYAIFIEDPFEQPENTARAVSARQLTKISEAFRMSHRTIVLTPQNQDYLLLGTLVRPQISKYFARTPVRSPSYTSGHYPTPRPQVHRTVRSPSHVQHQFQNGRVDNHSNLLNMQRPNDMTKQRTMQQYHIQGQQRPVQQYYTQGQQRPVQQYYTPGQQRTVQQYNIQGQQRPVQQHYIPGQQRTVQQYHVQGQQLWRPKADK